MRTIPILLYHSISDDPDPTIAPWTVSPRAFGEHVAALVDSGRTPLTITDLAARMRGAHPLPAEPVAVTFDDGYRDTMDAMRHLADAGIPATVFVTSGHIGSAGMMTEQELTDLCELGERIEFGAHSVTHRRLDELSEAELIDETAGSRARIQEVTKRACATFAYPHGSHDRASVSAVRAAGYSSAVAVRNALSHSDDNVFALARITIDRRATAASVSDILAGRFRVARPSEQLRTRGYRQFRRLRRRLQRTAPAARR